MKTTIEVGGTIKVLSDKSEVVEFLIDDEVISSMYFLALERFSKVQIHDLPLKFIAPNTTLKVDEDGCLDVDCDQAYVQMLFGTVLEESIDEVEEEE